jgi:hypothetical protein
MHTSNDLAVGVRSFAAPDLRSGVALAGGVALLTGSLSS